MRKITKNLLSLIGLVGVLTIVSCGEDDTVEAVAPSVTVTAAVDGTAILSGDEVTVGSSVDFTVTINAPGGVNGLTVGSTSYSRAELGAEAGDTSGSITLSSGALTEAQIGATISFDFVAVDELSQTTTETFSIVVGALPSPEARSYTAVLLAAPTGDFTNENFFSVASGEVYSREEVNATNDPISATIDFGYYYGSGEEASIASPSGFESTVFSEQVSGWGTKNATVLKTTTMTAAQFLETSTYADIDASFEAGTLDENGIITNLVAGETVLAFETVDGVKGLIYVSAIEPGFESDDNITLEILAQLEATN